MLILCSSTAAIILGFIRIWHMLGAVCHCTVYQNCSITSKCVSTALFLRVQCSTVVLYRHLCTNWTGPIRWINLQEAFSIGPNLFNFGNQTHLRPDLERARRDLSGMVTKSVKFRDTALPTIFQRFTVPIHQVASTRGYHAKMRVQPIRGVEPRTSSSLCAL